MGRVTDESERRTGRDRRADEVKEQEWLESHRNADVIVAYADTGIPVRAEYLSLRGIPRQFPVAYTFPEDAGFNLFAKEPTDAR